MQCNQDVEPWNLNGVFHAADVNDSIDQQAVLSLSPGGRGDNRGGALSCGASGATAGPAHSPAPVKLVWRQHHLGDTTLPALPGELETFLSHFYTNRSYLK